MSLFGNPLRHYSPEAHNARLLILTKGRLQLWFDTTQ